MAIPELDARGLLPAGVHDASMAEVVERFGRFQRTDRRVVLQAKLEEFVTEARATGLVASLILDGSFATGKPEPGDIDLIVVLHEGVDVSADFRPDQYNVVSARRVKARYPFDVFHAVEGSETLRSTVEFFAQVVGVPGLSKGMVRVAV